MSLSEILCIHQLEQPNVLANYLPGLWTLVQEWENTLCDDHGNTLTDLTILSRQLWEQMPYIWVACRWNGQVVAAASLTQVIPGRYAYLHGMRALPWRKHPAIRLLSEHVLHVAFNQLGVRKVKAEFEADNIGAIGFCRLHGFVKEAHFQQDIKVNGTWKDVVVYSLSRSTFEERQTHLKKGGESHVIR